MARVVPFRALRYSPGHAGEMALLAAPPYDVISETDRRKLEALHPRNVVRLILPGEAGRVEDGTFYEGAAKLLKAWVEEGTLQRDARPAFYPYRQTSRVPGGELVSRLGFLGALALPARGEGDEEILLHEKTLEGPRRDRTRLIQACRANLSPIFLLHPDSTGETGNTLHEVTGAPPLFAFEDAAGVLHEMWKLDEPAGTSRLASALDPDWSLIADGHHRYESALAVRDNLPGEEGAGYVLAFFCSLRDKGFRILPIHRLLAAPVEASRSRKLLEELQARHQVERLAPGVGADEILRRLQAAGERTVGVVTREEAPFLLRIAPKSKTSADPLEEFDTILLQKEIFSDTLAISDQDVTAGAIRYTSDAFEAVRRVQTGEAGAAFLLNPLRVESVVRAAQRGLRLPQKSTYFYPKVYTGLAIRTF